MFCVWVKNPPIYNQLEHTIEFLGQPVALGDTDPAPITVTGVYQNIHSHEKLIAVGHATNGSRPRYVSVVEL